MEKKRTIFDAHDGYITDLKWSPDGRLLASASGDNTIKLWVGPDAKYLRTLQGHVEVVSCLDWSPDGKWLASGSADKTVRLWGVWDQKLPNVAYSGHHDFVRDVAWLDNEVLLSSSEDGYIFFWRVGEPAPFKKVESRHGWTLCLAVSPDRKMFASGGGDGFVRIWDTKGKLLKTLKGHQEWVDDVAWHPALPILVSASGDKTIRVWDTRTGKCTEILEGHTKRVRSLIFDLRGFTLYSKGDATINIWDTMAWVLLESFEEEGGNDYWPPRIGLNVRDFTLTSLGDKEGQIGLYNPQMQLKTAPVEDSVKYIAAKIVLVGESGVGKTALGWRLSHDEYKDQPSTHGQQFWVLDTLKTTREDKTECEAVLWDLAGQRDYRLIHGLFLDDVDLAIIVINPADTVDPLKGAEFWLKTLQHKLSGRLHAILVGGRCDRGSGQFTQEYMDGWCRERGITGGYIATSALSGLGMQELLEKLKKEIAWEEKTVTTTSRTFKVIKEYVLRKKEVKEEGVQKILLTRQALEAELREYNETVLRPEGREFPFNTDEIVAATDSLSKHGFLRILPRSTGEEMILLTPEVLNNLASSIVLRARDNQEGLGAVEETKLRDGEYAFEELDKLDKEERQVLLDAVIFLFIQKNIAFRERIGKTSLLIFPELINLKKPSTEESSRMEEDQSYQVKGSIENLYGALVVLLGYTNVLTRENQWQHQALYKFEENELCGFRRVNEHEDQVEFVLLYDKGVSASVRVLFRKLFERFLFNRDVTVTTFRSIVCPNCDYRVSREESVRRLSQGFDFMFCPNDGFRINLKETQHDPGIGEDREAFIDKEQRAARMRTNFEMTLSQLFSFLQGRPDAAISPSCFISYAWGEKEHEQWVEKRLATDLKNAGVNVILDRWVNKIGAILADFIEMIATSDHVAVVGTPQYLQKYQGAKADKDAVAAAEMRLINQRLMGTGAESESVKALLLEGSEASAFPPLLRGRVFANFTKEPAYYSTLFEVLLALFKAPAGDPVVIGLRDRLKV